jgi:hypothetical protein
LLDGGSTVRAAAPKGAGGNVAIRAGTMFVPGGDGDAFRETGAIDASDETEELDGTGVIDAPELDLAGGLLRLDSTFVDLARVLGPEFAV